MTIHWDVLLGVFVVSFGSTIAVVVLVTLGLLGLSARTAPVGRSDAPTRPARFTTRDGNGRGRGLPGRRRADRAGRALGDRRTVGVTGPAARPGP